MKKDKVIKGLCISIIVMLVILIMMVIFIKIEVLKINVESKRETTFTTAYIRGGVHTNTIPAQKIITIELANNRLLRITKYEEPYGIEGKYNFDWF